ADPHIAPVRPLLDRRKEARLEYAAAAGLRFREDSTTLCLDIQRNRIRHELLPLLKRHYQPGLVKSVLRVMNIVGAESDLVKSEAENWLRLSSNGAAAAPPFQQLPVALQRRIIQLQLLRKGVQPEYD